MDCLCSEPIARVTFCKRFGLAEHNLNPIISGGQEAWIVREELARSGVPVVLTALDNLPGSFDGLGARLDNAALLYEAGVTVLFTSGETHYARKLRQVAGNAVANGLAHGAAVEAITSLPAEVFGGKPRMIALGFGLILIWRRPARRQQRRGPSHYRRRPDSMKSRQTQLLDAISPRTQD